MKKAISIFTALTLSVLALTAKASSFEPYSIKKIFPRHITLKIQGSREERTLVGLITKNSLKIKDTPLNIVTLRGALRLNRLSQQGIENVERTLLSGIDDLELCTNKKTCSTLKIGGYAEMKISFPKNKKATLFIQINPYFDDEGFL